MRVLVTGNRGYIGSVLVPLVLKNDYEVTGIDTGLYEGGGLYNENLASINYIKQDIRNIRKEELAGFDAIVHLAELSNDPLGQLAPQITYKINHEGACHLAKLAKASGIKRFIYMSSCSVYGIAEGIVDELSPISPQTVYAECKALVEKELNKLADDDFSPTFLRSATVYGASPQLRFDTAINNLCGLAWTSKEIKLTSDGSPWRPFIHVEDLCRVIIEFLSIERNKIHNQVFNLGKSEHNYQIKDVAHAIGSVFSECEISFGAKDPDNRSYQVSCDKLASILDDFQFIWDVEKGVKQLYDLFSEINLSADTFNSRYYTRLKCLEYLIKNQKLDSNFFWKL